MLYYCWFFCFYCEWAKVLKLFMVGFYISEM